MEPGDGPPINEVVLSISFGERESLAGPKLLIALRQLNSKYSEIEEQAPYEIPEELPTQKQLIRPSMPSIQLIGATQVKRRYWLTDKDDKSILVQAQSDYFAVNWRMSSTGGHYPGFARLKTEFFDALSLFNSSISEGGGAAIEARQVELAYVNVIKLPVDSAAQSIGDYLDISAPFVDDFEQLNVAYTRSIEGSDGDFFGRSYTTIGTGYQIRLEPPFHGPIDLSADLPLSPILNINTSVRSANFTSVGSGTH